MTTIGPNLYPLSRAHRAILIHWGYTNNLTIEEMARWMKVSPAVLDGAIHGRCGMKAVTRKRVIWRVTRLMRRMA